MTPSDTAVMATALPDFYLCGDFEDTLTERGPRVLRYEVEEQEGIGIDYLLAEMFPDLHVHDFKMICVACGVSA